MVIKKCAVIDCCNTNENEPDKVFVIFPIKADLRKRWHLAVFGRCKSMTSRLYVCEDHFDMQEDMENWIQYKLTGIRLTVKDSTVPHLNMDGKERTGSQMSPACKKRQRSFKVRIDKLREKDARKRPEFCSVGLHPTNYMPEEQPITSLQLVVLPAINQQPKEPTIIHQIEDPSINDELKEEPSRQPHEEEPPIKSEEEEMPSIEEQENNHELQDYCIYVKEEEDIEDPNSTLITPDIEDEETLAKNKLMCELHISRLEKTPMEFIGIESQVLQELQFLEKEYKIPMNNVYLTMEKIYLNIPNGYLSHLYNMSTKHVGAIFQGVVKLLAQHLQVFIYWLRNQNIQSDLFRKYRNVESVIACFEIAIQKPSSIRYQAETWSSHQHAHTIKYLISVTPHGHINFVSGGSGGRITNQKITEESGYMDLLPDGCAVMADESFTAIQERLSRKNCSLICSPSVVPETDVTKDESLHSIVQRVIRKIRMFSMTQLQARTQQDMVCLLDKIVVIVCALVNLDRHINK